MTLTAVFTRAPEGGYTALIEGIPGVISEGESIEEARTNLADALRTVLECNRELARQDEPASAVREAFELAAMQSWLTLNGICALTGVHSIGKAPGTRFGGTLLIVKPPRYRAIGRSKI